MLLRSFWGLTRCAKHNSGIAGERGNSAGSLQQNRHGTCAEGIAKFAEPQRPSTLVNAKDGVPHTELMVVMLKPSVSQAVLISCGRMDCQEPGSWGSGENLGKTTL